jgi:hypothetical protein
MGMRANEPKMQREDKRAEVNRDDAEAGRAIAAKDKANIKEEEDTDICKTVAAGLGPKPKIEADMEVRDESKTKPQKEDKRAEVKMTIRKEIEACPRTLHRESRRLVRRVVMPRQAKLSLQSTARYPRSKQRVTGKFRPRRRQAERGRVCPKKRNLHTRMARLRIRHLQSVLERQQGVL